MAEVLGEELRRPAGAIAAVADGLAGEAVLHVRLLERVASDHLEPRADVALDELAVAGVADEAHADQAVVRVAVEQVAEPREPRRLEVGD